MIYLISFLRRLKFKSTIYFSILPSIIVGLYTQSPIWLGVSLLAFPTVLGLLAEIVNFFDRRRITNVPCKLCAYEHCSLLYPARKKKQSKEKGSYACSSFDHGKYPNIYYCPRCKNGFLEHLLDSEYEKTKEEGHKLYEEVVDEDYVNNIGSRLITYKNIYQKYESFFKDKDVMEIGCYYGAFADTVQDKAKSYLGVEPSSHACEYLRKKYQGIQVINNNLEGALKSDEVKNRKFDTIVMYDVIEHLPNPVETLRLLNPFIKDGGNVIFSTINMEASISMVLGPFWPWFMDMHYYYFSDRGYTDILHRTGYTLNFHHHFPYYVTVGYFFRKVFSLVFGRWQFIENMGNKMTTIMPIKLGDTVLIAGTKEKI